MLKGSHASEETKRKMSQSHIGRVLSQAELEARQKNGKARQGIPRSPECCQKIKDALNRPETKLKLREAHRGKQRPPEVGRKISESLKGRPVSLDTRQKISNALKGRPQSEESKRKNSESNKGRTFTPEWRQKISQALTGKKLSLEAKEKNRLAHKGLSPSPEARQKLSRAMKGRVISQEWRDKIAESNLGEKHWNWQGGIGKEPYAGGWTKLFRRTIRQRDACICQLCNIPQNGRCHTVHHIDYDKHNVSEYDLITLCLHCNIVVNKNRAFWTNYFRKVMWAKYEPTDCKVYSLSEVTL